MALINPSVHFFLDLVRWTYPEIKEIAQNFKDQLGPNFFNALLQNNHGTCCSQVTKITYRSEDIYVHGFTIGNLSHKKLVKVEDYHCNQAGFWCMVNECFPYLKTEKIDDNLLILQPIVVKVGWRTLYRMFGKNIDFEGYEF